MPNTSSAPATPDTTATPSESAAPGAAASPPRCASPWWRVLAVALALALLLGWATSASMAEQLKAQIQHLQRKVDLLPQVRYLAVLLDQTQQPALLVTFDPGAKVLQLQHLNDAREKSQESLQLWALQDGKPPRSLGLTLSEYKTLQIAAQATELDGVAQLAISLEEKGGVPDSQGPRLPYLYQGWWVKKQ